MVRDPNIKLRHLRAFLEVARHKSVGRAAEALHVSQPAVTRTIGELEDLLDAQLFEREGRGIRITPAGQVFLRHAGASVAAIRQGVDALARGGIAAKPLRIGALPTVSAKIMPDAVVAFLREDPARLPRIVTGDNAVLLDQLRLGELDLVVGRLAAPERMSGLSFEPLYLEQVVFVCRAAHPLARQGAFSLQRLQDFTVLMPQEGSIIRPFVERLLISHGIREFRSRIETVSHSFGRAFTLDHDAVWIISHGVVASDLDDGRMVALPVDTSETRGAVGLTRRVGDPDNAEAEAFARILRTVAAG